MLRIGLNQEGHALNTLFFLIKMLNTIIPKNERGIYIRPLGNCKADNYDIINYTADTVLTMVNDMLKKTDGGKYTIYLEVYHPQRISKYVEYISKNKDLTFKFITSSKCFSSIKRLLIILRNLLIKLSCSYWISESVPDIKPYALKSQKQLIVGYATSCKSDCIYDNNAAARLRHFSRKENVTVLSTSFLDAIMKSSAYGVPMECFLPFGMARNDILGKKVVSDKAQAWLNSKKNNGETKVILYAPTFRDYEGIKDVQSRSIWGLNYDDDRLNKFLKESNTIVIAKLHSWQNKNAIFMENNSVILYDATFDFSFYDLFQLSDLMITDYSSIGLDWLFVDKPLIYNLWDYDIYRRERGFAYEPYEDLCGGEIVHNTDELIAAIGTALVKDLYTDKRAKIKQIMYSVQDHSSGEKTYQLLFSDMNDNNR